MVTARVRIRVPLCCERNSQPRPSLQVVGPSLARINLYALRVFVMPPPVSSYRTPLISEKEQRHRRRERVRQCAGHACHKSPK